MGWFHFYIEIHFRNQHLGCGKDSNGSLHWLQCSELESGNWKEKIGFRGCDNMVKIWNQDESGSWTEEANGKLEGHSDWVRDVAWAPSIGSNRSIIASCSQDRRVIIWT